MSESIDAARQARHGVGSAVAGVRAALADGSDPAGALNTLHDAWAHHVAVTESADGLLADVAREAPHLTHRCEVLTSEHASIADRLRALLSGTQPSPEHSGIEDALAAIDQHRHRGAELVYDAFNVDIATGD